MSDIIVGLDIGTYFIRTVVASVTPNNRLEVVGVSKVASSGLRNGVVVNLDAAATAIKEGIDQAVQSCGYEITSCFTGIGGLNIESKQSNGQVGVSANGKAYHEINAKDVDRAIQTAKAVRTNMESEILHVVPQFYQVDGVQMKNPIGTQAYRLEVNVLIITGSSTQNQNIMMCLSRAGLGVEKIFLKTLSASYAVTSLDELEAGSIIIDLGGGTTDVLMFIDGYPVCTASIALGQKDVTNDIAQFKGVATSVAEKIKLQSGCCWEELLDYSQKVIFPGAGGKPPEEVSIKDLCLVIKARVEEILTLAKQEIARKAPKTRLTGSIILIGGGALMPGAVELTQSVFKTSSVRQGIPQDLGGAKDFYRTPDYATAVGLVILGHKTQETQGTKPKRKTKTRKTSIMEKVRDLFAL